MSPAFWSECSEPTGCEHRRGEGAPQRGLDKWAGVLPWRTPRSTGMKSRLKSGRHALHGPERSEQSPLEVARYILREEVMSPGARGNTGKAERGQVASKVSGQGDWSVQVPLKKWGLGRGRKGGGILCAGRGWVRLPRRHWGEWEQGVGELTLRVRGRGAAGSLQGCLPSAFPPSWPHPWRLSPDCRPFPLRLHTW